MSGRAREREREDRGGVGGDKECEIERESTGMSWPVTNRGR